MNPGLSALEGFPQEPDKQGTEWPPRESQLKADKHSGVWGSPLEEVASEPGPEVAQETGDIPGGGASCEGTEAGRPRARQRAVGWPAGPR